MALPVGTSGASANTPVILHTSDGGKTWVESGRLTPYDPVCSYFRFFDGKHGVLIQTGAKDRILQTQDGGKTWKLSSESMADGHPGQFCFSTPADGWRVRTAGLGKASRMEWSRSTDGGVTWSPPVPVTSGADGYESFAVCFSSPSKGGILLAGCANGRLELLTTSDGGQSWDIHPLPESSAGSVDLAANQLPMLFVSDHCGWILAPHGLLATADGGRSWNWK